MKLSLRLVFPLLIALFIQTGGYSQTTEDSLIGKKIQGRLINLINDEAHQSIVQFVDSVEISYPEFLGKFHKFHAILLTTAA